jgi:2-keto-4-pentenoate hydratase/2-oxohepta-3-ene-1,7-dioic acid hydratase in catechol pathway
MSGLARIWDKTRKIVAIGRNYADHAKGVDNEAYLFLFFELLVASPMVYQF